MPCYDGGSTEPDLDDYINRIIILGNNRAYIKDLIIKRDNINLPEESVNKLAIDFSDNESKLSFEIQTLKSFLNAGGFNASPSDLDRRLHEALGENVLLKEEISKFDDFKERLRVALGTIECLKEENKKYHKRIIELEKSICS